MSHYMTALAMKQQGLTPAAKIVLYWLADHHNGETGDCFPSHKRLAELSEMTDRSVRNHLSDLADKGLIQIIQRNRDNGSQTSNEYLLILTDTHGDTSHRKNIPTPKENISTHPQKNLPTLNLVSNKLGKEPLYSVQIAFDKFWKIYPRKIGKAKAKDAFNKAVHKTTLLTIMDAVSEYSKSVHGKDAKFIPHASTWLNQERWDDEIEAPQGVDIEFRGMVNDLARLR